MDARRLTLAAVTLLTALSLAAPGLAAIKVRRPLLEEPSASAPAAGARPARSGEASFFVGSVIFARGAQIVAEVGGGARERERLFVYDANLRRRGRAVVEKALDDGVYLLRPEGSMAPAPGDRLSRESESEAAARVLRLGSLGGYREFLEFYPESRYRDRVGREMFRLVMKQDYPTYPGTVVEGRVRLAEEVSRAVPLGNLTVVLDRFIIARTDEEGRFRIEGIPRLPERVELAVRVKDPKFRAAEAAVVELPADEFQELAAEVPVRITPTVLAGTVVDEHGGPLAGAEVWTHPYTMEVLTDDQGAYQISRRKDLDASGVASQADEPLFGGEYEVYARRKGYAVERALATAESYQENSVPTIQVARQDPRSERIPALDLDLKAFLNLEAGALAAPQASGPVINP